MLFDQMLFDQMLFDQMMFDRFDQMSFDQMYNNLKKWPDFSRFFWTQVFRWYLKNDWDSCDINITLPDYFFIIYLSFHLFLLSQIVFIYFS